MSNIPILPALRLSAHSHSPAGENGQHADGGDGNGDRAASYAQSHSHHAHGYANYGHQPHAQHSQSFNGTASSSLTGMGMLDLSSSSKFGFEIPGAPGEHNSHVRPPQQHHYIAGPSSAASDQMYALGHGIETSESESEGPLDEFDPDGHTARMGAGGFNNGSNGHNGYNAGSSFQHEDAGSASQNSTPTNRMDTDTDPLETAALVSPILSQPRLSRAFSMPMPSQLGHLKNPRRISSNFSSAATAAAAASVASPTSSSSTAVDPLTSSFASIKLNTDPNTLVTAGSVGSVMALSSELSHLQEISLELADSVQLVIQTLLQLSPPQVLDPAKEQFAACSVSIPTPSLSAIFTSVKNLNYMAGNMAAFSSQGLPAVSSTSASVLAAGSTSTAASTSRAPVLNPIVTEAPPESSIVHSDFDIGELLQSVGDAVSGYASEVGVDVVLYHGDVGMKHIAVRGDECGVSYALTHVVRQVIAVAQKGDSIEVGLFVTAETVGEGGEGESAAPSPKDEDALDPSSISPRPTDRLRVTLNIAHKFAPELGAAATADTSNDTAPASPTSSRSRSASPPISPTNALRTRERPHLTSVVLRSLVRHLDATLRTDLQPVLFRIGRACELELVLERGDLSTAHDEDQDTQPSHGSLLTTVHGQNIAGVSIANEPTLEELTAFAETLKGRKVTLYASSKGSFAHHLSSYLTAWGLDVSHVAQETGTGEGVDSVVGGGIGEAACAEGGNVAAMQESQPQTQLPGSVLQQHTPPTPMGVALGVDGQGQETAVKSPGSATSSPASSSSSSATATDQLSFIFIDDNVDVLRERLRKLKNEHYGMGSSLYLSKKKPSRPSLAANHRPRSSPHVVKSLGLAPGAGVGGSGHGLPNPSNTVVVHFTSLSNFKLVKDVVQSVLSPHPGGGANIRVPEVIVIPKPAGPRRFLTALHTAVTKPIVDPFFNPIATSPMSPGLHAQAQYFPMHLGQVTPGSPYRHPSTASAPSANSHTSSRGSDRLARSPKDMPFSLGLGAGTNAVPGAPHPLPSPLSMSDGIEYFTEAAITLGGSPSTGLVIQSPAGQPAGIFFNPRGGRPSAGTHANSTGNGGAGGQSNGSRHAQGQAALDSRRVAGSSSSSTASGLRRTSDPHVGPHVGTPNAPGNLTKRPSEIVEAALGAHPTPLSVNIGTSLPPGTVIPMGSVVPMSMGTEAGENISSGGRRRVRKGRTSGAQGQTGPSSATADGVRSPGLGGIAGGVAGGASPGMPSHSSVETNLGIVGASQVTSPALGDMGGMNSMHVPIPLRPREPARKTSSAGNSAGRIATPPLSPLVDSHGQMKAGSPVVTPGARAARRVRGTGSKATVAATPPTPAVPAVVGKKGGKKGAGDTNIVPPISVLVVDDNPINQTILSTFMRKKKIKYDVAKNGEEAVNKWKTGGFHLILMDIQMPIMDGIQATKEIRRMEKMYGSLAPGTPISDAGHATPSEAASTDSKNPITPYRSSVIIVALTASSLQSDRVAALAAGCNDFLTKPVSLEWLNNKIIEWGSIKALQMWADLRPEVVKSIASGQVAKAQTIARKLHVPEGRATPVGGGTRSRSSSLSKTGFDSASSSMSPAGAIRNPRPPMVETFAQDSMPTPRPAPSPEIEPSAIDRPGAPTSLPDASDSAPTPLGPSVVVTEATPTVQEAREEMLKRAGAVPDLTEFPLPHQKPPSALSEAVVISHPEAESSPARADAKATAEAEATPTTLPPSEPVRAEALPTPEDTLVEPPSPPPMPGAMSQQLRERVPVGKDYAEKDGEERTNKEGSRGAQDHGEDDEMPTD